MGQKGRPLHHLARRAGGCVPRLLSFCPLRATYQVPRREHVQASCATASMATGGGRGPAGARGVHVLAGAVPVPVPSPGPGQALRGLGPAPRRPCFHFLRSDPPEKCGPGAPGLGWAGDRSERGRPGPRRAGSPGEAQKKLGEAPRRSSTTNRSRSIHPGSDAETSLPRGYDCPSTGQTHWCWHTRRPQSLALPPVLWGDPLRNQPLRGSAGLDGNPAGVSGVTHRFPLTQALPTACHRLSPRLQVLGGSARFRDSL